MTKSKRLLAEEAASAAAICACFNARRAARSVTRHFDDVLHTSGLRSTQFVLLVSIHARGEVGLPALAGALGLERSALTRRLAPLQRQGLLRVVASSAAGGPSTVTLTAKGRGVLERAVPLWREAQGRLVVELGGEPAWEQSLANLQAVHIAALHAARGGAPAARGPTPPR